jgi:hypothetical protein
MLQQIFTHYIREDEIEKLLQWLIDRNMASCTLGTAQELLDAYQRIYSDWTVRNVFVAGLLDSVNTWSTK